MSVIDTRGRAQFWAHQNRDIINEDTPNLHQVDDELEAISRDLIATAADLREARAQLVRYSAVVEAARAIAERPTPGSISIQDFARLQVALDALKDGAT